MPEIKLSKARKTSHLLLVLKWPQNPAYFNTPITQIQVYCPDHRINNQMIRINKTNFVYGCSNLVSLKQINHGNRQKPIKIHEP